MKPLSYEDCQVMDRQDTLRPLKDMYQLPQGLVYLDGNSLGVLPKGTQDKVSQAIQHEWGSELIRSWNSSGWFELPRKVGDKIAQLIGACPGEVVATDTTSINLYKVLATALSIAAADSPTRKKIVSERSNFPTDLYIAQAVCKERGYELILIDIEEQELSSALQEDVAVLMLTHVNYRTGAMHNMQKVSELAHSRGILTIWDLAHSAGAVPVHLHSDKADFAVGCGYKYLNGGPGAPAFVWANPKHVGRFWQPLAGWWGHDKPFEFSPYYVPSANIVRFQCGTQPILSLVALECGVDGFLAAKEYGGMDALRNKSIALTELFMRLVDERLLPYGISIVTPRNHNERGSQVSLMAKEGAYEIVQALIERGVLGDFRAGGGEQYPDILRFGFTPLYLGYSDVWNAVDQFCKVMQGEEWRATRFAHKNAVT
jgi:kynureninase